MIDVPEMYEFVSMVDFADHMISDHGMNYDSVYYMDRYQLHDLHTKSHTDLDKYDARRILDVLLSLKNEEPYPINAITESHLEKIIEKIDYQLDTGWTGFGYTVWMEGVGP
jgi:hypothetical protein